jgi:transcriptional regulator with XRE-family HTH domain
MPKKSKLKLMPVSFGNETLGERLARIRKERGLSQNEVAKRTGLTQVLVSNYECDRLRLSAEMAVRFIKALGITADELLAGKKKAQRAEEQPTSLKLLRRMKQIESLPLYEQRALLTTIDRFIEAAQAR